MDRPPFPQPEDDIRSIVAYGDCNTLGYTSCEYNAYPERLGRLISAQVLNLGRTMASTRELVRYARDFPPNQHTIGIVNYGLVDSWVTFRRAPYVLYYPDNPLRKALRVAVKKIKRFCTRSGIAARLGPAHVVPPDEFEQNVASIVSTYPAVTFVLLSAFPNLDETRNPAIQAYNEIISRTARNHPHNTIHVDLYSTLFEQRSRLFCEDGTHINDAGHDFVAQSIAEALKCQKTSLATMPHSPADPKND